MIIAVDLDDVLAEFAEEIFKYYNQIHGTNHKSRDLEEYKFFTVWGGIDNDTLRFAHKFHRDGQDKKVKPVKGAITAIKKLAKEHTLIIVTSREKLSHPKTLKWIDKYFPNLFKNVEFTKGEGIGRYVQSKPEICKRMGAKVIIEDRLKYSLECAKAGIRVVLIDKPWNRHTKLPKNVTRVKDWKGVLDYFKV